MIAAIIQARMSSTRLPGKMLVAIGGKPMLWHVVSRVRQAKRVDQVLVATSEESSDDPIADHCTEMGIELFRGSVENVLDRMYRAAKHLKADTIVRITGDCPLIDPDVIDKVIRTYIDTGCDYASNTRRYTYPDGLDTEVFSFAALERAWREATRPRETEHVTPYIRETDGFTLAGVEHDQDLSNKSHRWVVDEPRDLEFMERLFEAIPPEDLDTFRLADILRILKARPDIYEINQGIILNEGAYISFMNEEPVPARDRCLARSLELKARAEKLIPTCSQTFSKAPTQFVQGVAPVFLARGEGSHVWDVDGNEYIDYPMALGPIILGHNYPAVTEAVTRQMKDGNIYSLPHPLEVEVAELLVELIPSAEMVRFGKNGSDVTTGAVRAARAFTGRELIACCGYHGWQDWYIGTTTRNQGVPQCVREQTLPFEYNQIESLERILQQNPGKIAAVIMEPVGIVEPQDGFLQQVLDLTHEAGALLIFDEIVTGFRVALGGAQEYYGVTPDMTCCGKAMGNGYPASAVVGRRDVMEWFDEIFFSFTFGGDALS